MAEFTQIRRIDDLGRICIPREIRKNLGINEGDPLKITLISNSIIIRPTPSDASVQAALDRFLLNLKYDFDIDPDLREELRRKTLEMKDLAQNAQEKHKKGERMNKNVTDLIQRLHNPKHFIHGETGVYYNVDGMDQLCEEAANALSTLCAFDPIVLTKENLRNMAGKKVLVKRMGSHDPAEFATVKDNGDCRTDTDCPCYHELYGSTWIAFLYPENAL